MSEGFWCSAYRQAAIRCVYMGIGIRTQSLRCSSLAGLADEIRSMILLYVHSRIVFGTSAHPRSCPPGSCKHYASCTKCLAHAYSFESAHQGASHLSQPPPPGVILNLVEEILAMEQLRTSPPPSLYPWPTAPLSGEMCTNGVDCNWIFDGLSAWSGSLLPVESRIP